jgi:hypothetical protein
MAFRLCGGLVLAGVLLAVYWPMLSHTYLHPEDWDPVLKVGWTPAWLDRGAESAWHFRLVSLGLVVAFATVQAAYLYRLGIRWTASVTLSFATCVLPGMLVCVS